MSIADLDSIPAPGLQVPTPLLPASHKLMPHRGRMILVDRVLSLSVERREVSALKYVARNDPALVRQGRTAFYPGTLVLESLAQTAAHIMHAFYYTSVLHVEAQRIEALCCSDGPSHTEPQHEESVTAASVEKVPLSVLAWSRLSYHSIARPGEQIELWARATTVRSTIWCFDISAKTTRPLADGALMLAWPDYMNDDAVSARRARDEAEVDWY